MDKINEKANKFREYTGIIINVNDIIDDLEDKLEEELLW